MKKKLLRTLPVILLVVVALPMMGQQSCCPETEGNLTVFNNTSLTMVGLSVSPITDPYWTNEQLVGETVVPNASRTVTSLLDGVYDLRAVFERNEGGTIEVYEWAVSIGAGEDVQWILSGEGTEISGAIIH